MKCAPKPVWGGFGGIGRESSWRVVCARRVCLFCPHRHTCVHMHTCTHTHTAHVHVHMCTCMCTRACAHTPSETGMALTMLLTMPRCVCTACCALRPASRPTDARASVGRGAGCGAWQAMHTPRRTLTPRESRVVYGCATRNSHGV